MTKYHKCIGVIRTLLFVVEGCVLFVYLCYAISTEQCLTVFRDLGRVNGKGNSSEPSEVSRKFQVELVLVHGLNTLTQEVYKKYAQVLFHSPGQISPFAIRKHLLPE